MRVMILSRSFAVTGFLSELLTDEGHEVDSVAHAREALAELRAGRHELVVVDEASGLDVPLASISALAPVLRLAARPRVGATPSVRGILARPIDADAVRRVVRAMQARAGHARPTLAAAS